MINQVYRLVSPRQFEVAYIDESLQFNGVVVRPTHLSICPADQRYYTGSRKRAVLSAKLPMALIHEGIGLVKFDASGQFPVGTSVVMIPNTPVERDEVIAENYLRSSKFRSSGYDGFMQDYVFLPHHRVVPLYSGINLNVAAFLELISVGMHAIRRLETKAHARRETFGVWGDGSLGYITALLLTRRFPQSRVIVFGKSEQKLNRFSFASATYPIDKIPDTVSVDHAVECAGGVGSPMAINQIIEKIRPEGYVSILSVSEYPVEVNTRMVLEKGLTVVGSSRSGRIDFVETVRFLQEHPEISEYLQTLIGTVREVHTMSDVRESFEQDLATGWGKTVMRWNV